MKTMKKNITLKKMTDKKNDLDVFCLDFLLFFAFVCGRGDLNCYNVLTYTIFSCNLYLFDFCSFDLIRVNQLKSHEWDVVVIYLVNLCHLFLELMYFICILLYTDWSIKTNLMQIKVQTMCYLFNMLLLTR